MRKVLNSKSYLKKLFPGIEKKKNFKVICFGTGGSAEKFIKNLEYSNLFVSCNSFLHCSSKKDTSNLTRENFNNLISPFENKNDDNFTFSYTGEILGKNEKANFTKDTFELNQISLTEERKTIILNFEYYKDLSEEELIDSLNGHSSLIKHLKSQ